MSQKQISISFFGAADEVTGSRHLIEIDGFRLLLDCGLFQGHRRESIEKNKVFPFDPKSIDAVVLSHAHIDHSGGLPLLVKAGFSGPIYCTAPTADLCKVMLMDSAHLQEEDAKFFNKIHAAEGMVIEPLYNEEDADKAISLLSPRTFNDRFQIHELVSVQLFNAGHVLGSAMVNLHITTPKAKRSILFTGDLGRSKSLLLNPPEVPPHVDDLLIESTYGGRFHESVDQIENKFMEIIQRAHQEKGKILIPSFALERTQEIVFVLEKLRKENKIPPIHLYVDSPMAVSVTEIFDKYLSAPFFNPAFKKYVQEKGDPFGFKTIRYVKSVEESKQLNDIPGEKIILSASGMLEGGRILHHLRNNIDNENTTILIVGYQAEGTLGRRLVQGAKKVKIFGLEHQVLARVEFMHQFSSHADQNDLVSFIKKLDPRPRNIFLIHGENEGRMALQQKLKEEGVNRVSVPHFRENVLLD